MDIETDRSNTEILIEMVDNVTHQLEALNKKFEAVARIARYKSGKATTVGKDSDLRQVLRDILEGEGFDVR